MTDIELKIRIQQLDSLRRYLKIELNSNYGMSQKNLQSLLNRRSEVTEEMNKLYKLKNRRSKLNKIINRTNETSMEV